jgi:hypothetical protein
VSSQSEKTGRGDAARAEISTPAASADDALIVLG